MISTRDALINATLDCITLSKKEQEGTITPAEAKDLAVARRFLLNGDNFPVTVVNDPFGILEND